MPTTHRAGIVGRPARGQGPCPPAPGQRAPTLGDRRSISPHERTRRDHATETAEDYVETIAQLIAAHGSCRVTDLAARFGVTHVTVIRTIQRLEREGLVATEPYKPVELTARGKRLAEECAQRHDVVYRFLLAIGLDPATAAVDAEGIEHHVSRATLERFRALAQTLSPPPPTP